MKLWDAWDDERWSPTARPRPAEAYKGAKDQLPNFGCLPEQHECAREKDRCPLSRIGQCGQYEGVPSGRAKPLGVYAGREANDERLIAAHEQAERRRDINLGDIRAMRYQRRQYFRTDAAV